LTEGLVKLQDIVADGHHDGDLAILEQFQPDWFTQVLWGLYECMDKFLQRELSEDDLRRGAMLANPLEHFNSEVQRFSEYRRPKCPPSILRKQLQDHNIGQEIPKQVKRPVPQEQQGDDATEIAKKLRNSPEGQKRYNPKYDSTLKATKQAIIQHHGRVNLGLLMRANGTTTPHTLSALGLQTTSCGRYKFWGVCGDPACKLKHDDTVLTSTQVATVNSLMIEGAKKLPKAQQN